MTRSIWGRRPAITALCIAGLIMATTADAQRPQKEGKERTAKQETSQQSLRIPSESAMVGLRANMPAEVRVGERFSYDVEVTNLTDDIILHNIKIKQQSSDTLKVEQARLGKSQQTTRAGGQQPKRSAEKRSDQARSEQQGPSEQADAREQPARQNQQNQQVRAQQAEQGGSASASGEWTIDKLEPGETRLIHVEAASDQEGQARACLAITSYQPSLCLTTKVVKPQLELVKKAPDKASLCGDIEFEYFVKNTGTGETDKFTIRDELSDGLQTINGDKNLEFQVDSLKADETKKFVAKLVATKTGDFSSRAVAERKDGETTRSNQTSTSVEAAELAVSIEGPRVEYINRPLTYRVEVANRGNAPANDARLTLHIPEDATVAHISDPRRADSSPAGSALRSTRDRAERGEPAKARRDDQARNRDDIDAVAIAVDDDADVAIVAADKAASEEKEKAKLKRESKQTSDSQSPSAKQQKNEQKSQQGEGERFADSHQARRFKLGTLEPGQSVTLTVTMRSREAQVMKHKAVAEYVCDIEQNQARTEAVAMAETRLIALPALLLVVVDNEDPIAQGEEVTYTVMVENQGDAPDNNVEITAELPQGLEFVDAKGPTKVNQEGGKLTFEPVEELEAGRRAVWRVTTKVKGEGDIVFKASLSSEGLSRTAIAEEPTTLFQR